MGWRRVEPFVFAAAARTLVELGRRPVVNMRVGASDARIYRGAGVATAVYGPTPYNMGGPDEHVALEELYTLARVYALTALDFLSA